MTMVHELSDLDGMKNLGVWLKGMILGREFRALDSMNSSGL